MENRTERRRGPRSPEQNKSPAGAGCALAGRPPLSEVQSPSAFQKGRDKLPWGQRRDSRGVRCHPHQRGCFLKFVAATSQSRGRKGVPARLFLGNLSAPGGAAVQSCRPPPTPPPPASLPSVRRPPPGKSGAPAESSAWQALTLAAGRHQAGGESQQQRARHRRPALHPADGPGPRPRRSFPERWARVAHSSGASAGERLVRTARRRAPSGRKRARPGRPVFLPAPVPTLRAEHKAL